MTISDDPIKNLNEREKRILEAIKQGIDLDKLADDMRLSINTVKKFYLKTLFLKLKSCSTVNLAQYTDVENE